MYAMPVRYEDLFEKYFSLLTIMLSFVSGHITTMEVVQPKTLYHDTVKDVGVFNPIPDEIILEILLYALDWKASTLNNAFGSIKNVSSSCKYFYVLVYEKLLPINKVAILRNELHKLKLLKSMKEYTRNNRAKWDRINDWNALHIAAEKHDEVYIKEIMPQLVKLNMLHIINEEISEAHISPFERLFINMRLRNTDEKTAQLVQYFSDNGAIPKLMKPLILCLQADFPISARLLVAKSSCEQIMYCINILDGPSTRFIRQNHVCDTCTFE